ncbi:MAG TPA: single-stranded DNA-binding protein [Candidatus Portnoybacteria bacterium]|uniref:Single-stranded DNA-binding protein n=1 Tax=Candidatus Portnoybacteria bacterium CG02_land_8_20_14_3_00_45_8 TaxID=1974807 RepID=A0A2M7D6I9_9BACT|nr:MAG: single-stranded DNA-binding protein [Candidatus Portnoybacteria bacterium CG02_land_8_20_14_3_00_45_8]HCX27661.1 single-stranded DNA-binding protein [Candidatus Portnoybacteria bacterium]
MQNKLTQIKDIIEEILRQMDFSGEVVMEDQDPEFLRANIKSPEAAYLIGRGGEVLLALQEIIRAAVAKKISEPVRFIVDVNDYRQSHFALLKEMAQRTAQEVQETGQEQWLAPMNSYERRVVHLALKEIPGVKSESDGLGEERRIVIRPDSS